MKEQDAATNQISRNVLHSAQAVEAVTERIVEVAREEAATGSQAKAVQSLLDEMNHEVGSLSDVLTKLFRVAMEDCAAVAN